MDTNTQSSGFNIPLWLIVAACVGLIFAGLGSFAILDNNEGLYAEIPREMLAAHDWRSWVIPHLNGLPYMEKPPLLYWLTAISFTLFGISEWSARLVPALSSLTVVWLLVWFGRKVNHALAGRLAALMFISGVGVMAMSHVLMFDMLLAVFLTAALMFALLHLTSEYPGALRKSYACLALALLAKGGVAVALFGLVIVAFIAITWRSASRFRSACLKMLEPKAILIFFAIAVPWHVIASFAEPAFASFYFINEHVLRFLGRREPHDYYSGAWWYYLPRMMIYLFPWSFLLASLLIQKKNSGEHNARLKRFLWLAWLMPLLFFSISSAKANYYLVVVMPFAAFHLALALEERGYLSGFARALPGLAIALLAVVSYLLLKNRSVGSGDLLILGMAQQQFVSVLLLGALGLALAAALAAARLPRVGLAAYLVLSLWIGGAMMAILPAAEPLVSARQTAHYLQSELPAYEVYLYRNFEEHSSLAFYLRHPVPVVESRSNDLYWGNKLQSNDIVISREEFVERAERGKVAILVPQRQSKFFVSSAMFAKFKRGKQFGNSFVFYN